MNKNDKILVTGGTGFIGSYILRELIQQGYENIHAIRRPDSEMALVQDFQHMIHWHTADLDDVDKIYEITKGSQRVIHSAGLVSFSPGDRDLLYEINARGTEYLVNACLENQVARLIHISSIAALAKVKNGEMISEKTTWTDDKHTSHYGRSKHLGEIEVWRGMAEGLDAIILNPTVVLGAGIWESSSCQLFMQIFKGLKYYTPGSTGFVDVRDVARIAVSMMTTSRVNEAYVINESNYRFRDIFTWMAQGLDVPPVSRLAPRWIARGIVNMEYIKSKLTGIRPVITSDSVRNAYENFHYSNQKIKSLGFSFIPIEQTIRETTELLREAAKNDFKPALLHPVPVSESNLTT